MSTEWFKMLFKNPNPLYKVYTESMIDLELRDVRYKRPEFKKILVE